VEEWEKEFDVEFEGSHMTEAFSARIKQFIKKQIENELHKQYLRGFMKLEKCSCCLGSGKVMRYAKKMPELEKYPCEKCDGLGEVWVIDKHFRHNIVRDNISCQN